MCYLGIDNRKFKNQHQEKDAFVVGVGAIVPEKNIAFVIEALSKVPYPRPRLVWIGNVANNHTLRELCQFAASVGVNFAPRIRVSDDEIIDTLNKALMMVYAPRLEPFGLAPLEANACGLPVVAVTEGGVRETILDQVNGLLVEHDARSMAEAIQHLMDDPAYARQQAPVEGGRAQSPFNCRGVVTRSHCWDNLCRYCWMNARLFFKILTATDIASLKRVEY